MHIPDGMISPSTAMVANLAMVPVWWFSGARLRRTLGSRQAPLLGVCAAFCFTIMMFNVPALGGTTAHAVGATLAAVLLGPWAAVVTVTAALAIQALFFADGGVLAIGANSFAMAFVQPLVGYGVYRALRGRFGPALAAGAGAYVALVCASLVVAILLGVQPAFFHTAEGQAIYFPFGLKVTLLGILPTHLLVAGPIEAVVTAAALRFATASGIASYDGSPDENRRMNGLHRVGVAFLVLLALTPFGLLAQGDAWGEWDAAGVKERAGYAPSAVVRQEETGWKGFGALADYGSERGPMFYILSGALGVTVLATAMVLLGKALARKSEPPKPKHTPPGPPAGLGGELPDWLSGPSEEPPPTRSGKQFAAGFVRKSLAGVAAGAEAVVFGERQARSPGFLQALDPRAKVLAMVVPIVVGGWAATWAAQGVLFVTALVLAALSRVPLGAFLKRVWLTVPLVVGVVALPAALNVVTPGEPLFAVWSGSDLAVTREGLHVAGLLVARVGVVLSFALLLTTTTRWSELLHALRTLGVPKVFVVVLSTTYRYIELLLRSAAEMLVARRSRTVGPGTHGEGRRYVGNAFAALFGRSVRLADDVHAAMVSRGFTGEFRTAGRPRMRWSDWAAAGVPVLAAALAVAVERIS